MFNASLIENAWLRVTRTSNVKCIGENSLLGSGREIKNFIRLSECFIQSKIKICLFKLNSLSAAKASTTMERVTNAECADAHLAHGAENSKSREAFISLPLPNNEFFSNTFQIRSPCNSLTKNFRPNRYWAKSVYFNGPNFMLKFVQESAGHSV